MATLTIVPSIDRSSCHARTNGSSRHRQPSHSAFDLKAAYLCLSANANVALVESYFTLGAFVYGSFKRIGPSTGLLGGAGSFDIKPRLFSAQTHTLNDTVPASQTWGVGVRPACSGSWCKQRLSLQLPSWRCFVGSVFHPRDGAASKFENRINYAHDVAVVRHNNESAAPVPACAT